MEKEKLYKIIRFNKEHSQEIQRACSEFYLIGNKPEFAVIADIQFFAKFIFESKGYKFIHIPMRSKEIGAFQLQLNNLNYLVLNSAKSVANNNFAIAHEIYHVLIQKSNSYNRAEVYIDTYEDNEDEMIANAFAGNILMPKQDFLQTVHVIDQNILLENGSENKSNIHHMIKIFNLMNYYKTTYMSVVIRCYELGVFNLEDEKMLLFLLGMNSEEEQKCLFDNLKKKFGSSIMEPTYVDDFDSLYEEAKEIGNKNLKDGAITREDFEYRLKGIREAYLSIVEDHDAH